jgi:hypothetical protein
MVTCDQGGYERGSLLFDDENLEYKLAQAIYYNK